MLSGIIAHQRGAALARYATQIQPARNLFAHCWSLGQILSPRIDSALLELFRVHFSVLGVEMIESSCVWTRRASERCRGLGFSDAADMLAERAQCQTGRHRKLVSDASRLVARWNTRRRAVLDARRL